MGIIYIFLLSLIYFIFNFMNYLYELTVNIPTIFQSKLGNLHLCEAALRILTVLAKSSTSTQLER